MYNVIISSYEHNSVARPVYAMSKENISYSVAKVYDDYSLTIRSFEELITPETKAIVCMVGSNVTGQIMPFREIAAICRKHDICFIADGAQGCGVIPVKMSDGINILCTSGHKSLYGISGTGLLITDGKYRIPHIMEGGTGSTSLELEQPDFLPDSLESGTINTVGAISLGAGIDFITDSGLDKIFNHETMLCNIFISEISAISDVIIYRKPGVKYLPIVSFNIEGITSNQTAESLSDKGFALRGGLHCSGLAHKEIGTLPDGTVRFSPSVFNTANDVRQLVYAIRQTVKEKNSNKL